MALVTGLEPNQVPTNGDLGSMAYQEHDNVNVVGGRVAALLSSNDDAGYPEARASVALDCLNTRTLDGRVNFARNSMASYFDRNGVLRYAAPNEARFDHNPLTGEAKGLLFEPARTNLFLRSTKFDAPEWAKAASSIVANATTAPDGTMTGDRLVEDTADALHTAAQIITAASVDYTVTIYAKRDTRSVLYFRETLNGTTVNTFFDLAAGLVGSVGSGRTASIQNVGFGWYRCSMTVTASATSRIITFGVSTADGVTTYVGDGASGLFIWGAQIEASGFATSFIPTDLTTMTRPEDSMILQGKYFSDAYNIEEGTLLSIINVERFLSGDANAGLTVSSGDAARQNIVLQRVRPNGSLLIADSFVRVLNTTQVDTGGYASLTASEVIRIASAYNTNDYAESINGSAIESDTVLNTPRQNVDRFEVRQNGGTGVVAYLRDFRFFPKRLKNEALQFLTAVK